MDISDKAIDKILGKLKIELENQTESITRNVISAVNAELQQMQEKLESAQEKITTLEQKVFQLERTNRQQNIIFHGIECEKGNELEIILEIVNSDMGITLSEQEIDYIRKLGERKSCPILLKLSTVRKRNEILKTKKTLRGKNINISEDYPKEVIEERKALKEQLTEERKKGKIAYINYNKLIIKESITTQREKRKQQFSPSTQDNVPNPTKKLAKLDKPRNNTGKLNQNEQ